MNTKTGLQDLLVPAWTLLRAGMIAIVWIIGVSTAHALQSGDPDLITRGADQILVLSLTCCWIWSLFQEGDLTPL